MPLDTFIYTRFSDFGAHATLNVKATAAQVFSFKCHNNNSAARYIQFHNTATTPNGNDVPQLSFLVPGNSEIVIGTEFFGTGGEDFSIGLAFAFSTTEGTYTAATASDQFTYVRYR